jgi:hypothetical protein
MIIRDVTAFHAAGVDSSLGHRSNYWPCRLYGCGPTGHSQSAWSSSDERGSRIIVFRGEQLDALPDDLDLLVAALQALAGTAAGPDGGEIIVDGFAGARKSPKGSIREVPINQNPFSAEFDRPGFGRVEILTKAGASNLAATPSLILITRN